MATDTDVKVVSIPCPPLDVKISHYDQTFPTVPVQLIFCFPLPQSQNLETVTRILSEAFRLTVHECPILATSTIPFPPQDGGAPQHNRIIGEGSANFCIKDWSKEINYADLRKSGFDQSRLIQSKLCPYDRMRYQQDEPVTNCRFQANIVDGGILLVMAVLHILMDTKGCYEVAKMFASNCRKVQNGSVHTPKQFDRELLLDRPKTFRGTGAPGNPERHAGYEFGQLTSNSLKPGVPYYGKTYRIPDEARLELSNLVLAEKDVANNTTNHSIISSSPSLKPTRFDVLQAFLVRSLVRAHHRAGTVHMKDDDPVLQSTFVEARARLGIPENYLGNAFYSAMSTVPFGVVNNDDPIIGLRALTYASRAEIIDLDGPKFRDLLGFYDHPNPAERQIPGTKFMSHAVTDGFSTTSYEKFKFYDLDFGPLGNMEALRFSSHGYLPGLAVVYPHPKDRKCTEFTIMYQDAVFAELEKDAFFMKYAEVIR